jgi:hypothetical protein
MCPDIEKKESKEEGREPGVPFPFLSPRDNPLYDYLIDLYWKRVELVNKLAPRRHLGMQLWGLGIIVGLWVLDVTIPAISGLGVFLLLLCGAVFISYSPFVAGQKYQMHATRNFPSPMDYTDPLGIILETALSEREIVSAIVRSSIQYQFMYIQKHALLLYIYNIIMLGLAISISYKLNMSLTGPLLIGILRGLPFFIGFSFLAGYFNHVNRVLIGSMSQEKANKLSNIKKMQLALLDSPFILAVIVVFGISGKVYESMNWNVNILWIIYIIGLELALLLILSAIQIMLAPRILKILRVV